MRSLGLTQRCTYKISRYWRANAVSRIVSNETPFFPILGFIENNWRKK